MSLKPVTVPDDYPETGELDGKIINLREVVPKLSRLEVTRITVDLPDSGKIRPWKELPLFDGDDGF